jgi:hypothetical protein
MIWPNGLEISSPHTRRNLLVGDDAPDGVQSGVIGDVQAKYERAGNDTPGAEVGARLEEGFRGVVAAGKVAHL